ncbi:hypothetical protein ACTZWW_13600 [Salinarimonas sp. NSM]
MSRLVILTRRARLPLRATAETAMEVVSLAVFVAMVAAWASIGA